jgi:dipeptidyl aminopeptidase/acylaminoacyl peptidase
VPAPFRRYLQVRSARSPRFSADGRWVYHLADTTGLPQVWRVATDGAALEQLTFEADRVTRVDPAPREGRLAFSMDVDGSERHQLYLLDPERGEPTLLTDRPGAVHHFGAWRADGRAVAWTSNRRNGVDFDLYIQELDGLDPAEPRLLLEGVGTWMIADWSRGGTNLLAIRFNSNLDADLYLVAARTGERRHLNPRQGEDRILAARLHPDGRRVFLASSRDAEFSRLAWIDLADGKLTPAREDACDTDALALSPDGEWLAETLNVGGYSRLELRRVGPGDPGAPAAVGGLPAGVIEEAAFSPDGALLALALDRPDGPPDVWIAGTTSPRARQLTVSGRAGLHRAMLTTPELVRIRADDGVAFDALWFAPRAPLDTPPPVVIDVHGGPESQRRPIWLPVQQYLAGQGYAVLSPNVRGSTGYGQYFTHLDDVEKRMDAVADLARCATWLAETRRADARRIALFGGSYGGFMVLSAASTYPDLWAAAVDIVGIASLVTFLQNTSPYRRYLREAEYGSLEHDRDFLESISPLNHVDRIRCPLFVLHGAQDPRVPVSEAEQLVAALRERGREVEYLCFEDEGHGLVKLPNRLAAYPAIAAFLDRHLAPPGGWNAEERREVTS